MENNINFEELSKLTGRSIKSIKIIAGIVPIDLLGEALIDPIYSHLK